MPEITMSDIRALRHADSITVHYDKRMDQTIIRAHLDADHSPTGFDQQRDILATSRMSYWEGDKSKDFPVTGTCYVHLGSSRYSLEIQTWLGTLHAGDELEIHWLGGNTSLVVREHGLTVDEAWLVIKRPSKNRQYKFYLDSSVTTPDSSARMVRPV